MKKEKKLGLTLAEVLITLTIIGVVAAVTVPTLTKKTGNQETVTRLQKVYSVLSQATDSIILNKGNVRLWGANSVLLYNYYKEYLRNSKDCGTTSGCYQSGVIRTLNNGETSWNWDNESGKSKLILADGTVVILEALPGICSLSNWGSMYQCAKIFVDINGKKKPNIFGRDVFFFSLKEDGLHPGGCDSEATNYDECKLNSAGYSCTCKIITEGEMNY